MKSLKVTLHWYQIYFTVLILTIRWRQVGAILSNDIITTRPADACEIQAMSEAGVKLRIGVLLDSVQVTAWARHMLDTIQNSDYADIHLLIVDDGPEPEALLKNQGLSGKLCTSVAGRAAQMIYHRFIERDSKTVDAFALKDVQLMLPDVPLLPVATVKKAMSDFVPQDAVDIIKTYDLDVVIRIGFRILRGNILGAAKHGIWSYHHGDNHINRGGPPGFWETMESWPETGSVLQVLNEDLDNGRVLYRSWSATDRFSVRATRNTLYWKTQTFIPRMLQRLQKDSDEFYAAIERNEPSRPTFYSNRLYVRPDPFEHLRLVLSKAWQKCQWIVHNKRNLTQWTLMFDLRDGPSTSAWRYRTLTPPKDRFWADPHLIRRDGKYYVFLEELIYSTKRAHISVMEINDDGTHTLPRTILQKPYHLSYPFVFEHDGDTWMIPESAGNNTVELYRSVEFPDRWEHHMNLMEGVSAVDATLYQHDGLWWMFVNEAAHPSLSRWDELHLYYAQDFRTNQWTAHPLNPIVSDVRSARPAGKLFIDNGVLYRPSQNCSHCYGYGLNLNEVHTLSTTDYRESVTTAITPDWRKDVVACHSFNHVDRLSVIDAMVVRRR